MVGSFVVHGMLLAQAYVPLMENGLFRPEAAQQELFPFMIAAHIIMAGAFVWIYQHGAENKPWLAQGARFGIAVALLAAIPTYMIDYVAQPTPVPVVVQQIGYDSVLLIILGAVVAFLNKPAAAE